MDVLFVVFFETLVKGLHNSLPNSAVGVDVGFQLLAFDDHIVEFLAGSFGVFDAVEDYQSKVLPPHHMQALHSAFYVVPGQEVLDVFLLGTFGHISDHHGIKFLGEEPQRKVKSPVLGHSVRKAVGFDFGPKYFVLCSKDFTVLTRKFGSTRKENLSLFLSLEL